MRAILPLQVLTDKAHGGKLVLTLGLRVRARLSPTRQSPLADKTLVSSTPKRSFNRAVKPQSGRARERRLGILE